MNAALQEAIRSVVDNASTDGCSDDLIVTSKCAIEALAEFANQPSDPITIVMDGSVETIFNIPPGSTVRVENYDLDHIVDEFEYDEDGDPYQVITFEG